MWGTLPPIVFISTAHPFKLQSCGGYRGDHLDMGSLYDRVEKLRDSDRRAMSSFYPRRTQVIDAPQVTWFELFSMNFLVHWNFFGRWTFLPRLKGDSFGYSFSYNLLDRFPRCQIWYQCRLCFPPLHVAILKCISTAIYIIQEARINLMLIQSGPL